MITKANGLFLQEHKYGRSVGQWMSPVRPALHNSNQHGILQLFGHLDSWFSYFCYLQVDSNPGNQIWPHILARDVQKPLNLNSNFQGSQNLHFRVAISHKDADKFFWKPCQINTFVLGLTPAIISFLVNFVYPINFSASLCAAFWGLNYHSWRLAKLHPINQNKIPNCENYIHSSLRLFYYLTIIHLKLQ